MKNILIRKRLKKQLQTQCDILCECRRKVFEVLQAILFFRNLLISINSYLSFPTYTKVKKVVSQVDIKIGILILEEGGTAKSNQKKVVFLHQFLFPASNIYLRTSKCIMANTKQQY